MGISIPINTENNPQRDRKENANAIALRSGKTLGNSDKPINKEDDELKTED
ncbi:hypothetical protein PVK06_019928 [Gossypium arboreum]|uniref:Uncharacterized protein n=1 Tax=Gossypium arboreum TaxID=29729 RepID=A0ABR0PL06_GOSAR|nr:hypothetical protein PVK06_019928 [Gossypium arboreum]